MKRPWFYIINIYYRDIEIYCNELQCSWFVRNQDVCLSHQIERGGKVVIFPLISDNYVFTVFPKIVRIAEQFCGKTDVPDFGSVRASGTDFTLTPSNSFKVQADAEYSYEFLKLSTGYVNVTNCNDCMSDV